MLGVGPALKVTVHLNEDVNSPTDFLHTAILKFLLKEGVAGATVFHPQAGFGVHHQMHAQKGGGWTEGRHLPVQIEFVESKSKLEALLPQLCEMLTDGMIEAQETNVLKIVEAQRHPKGGND